MTDDGYRGPGRLGTGMRHIVWRLETAIPVEWPVTIERVEGVWSCRIETPDAIFRSVDDTFDGAVKMAYREIEP